MSALNLDLVRRAIEQKASLEWFDPRAASLAASIAAAAPAMLDLLDDAARFLEADGYVGTAEKIRAGERLYGEDA